MTSPSLINEAVTNMPWIYPLLGIVVGTFSGLLGLGGGWLITPALNILGFPASTAVGTTLTQMMGSSSMGALKHWRLGNLRPALATVVVVPLIMGVLTGKSVMSHLAELNLEDSVLRHLHLGLGIFLAFTILREVLSKNSSTESKQPKTAGTVEKKIHLPLWGPRLVLQQGIVIPYYGIIIMAFTGGLASALMGIGGGLIMVPSMIYIFGIPTVTAVATNLACIFFGTSVGAVTYYLDGNVQIQPALLLMMSSATGSYIGAALSAVIDPKKLRLFFGLLLVVSTSSIILKQLDYSLLAQITIFGGASLLWILILAPVIVSKIKKGT